MKPRHLGIIAKKEFSGLFNERTILLAVLLQLFIALFSSFLMVGLTSMYDPTSLSKYSHYKYNIVYAGNSSPLLGAITALHYRERTAAQFVFSTTLVVVILFVLALPANPLNVLTRLAVGSAGMEQWALLGATIIVVLVLGYILERYAGRMSRRAPNS